MKITTIGRGQIGGGLARLWREAGHEVDELGRDGGNVSDAEVVLVAVPGDEIPTALATISGFHGQVTLDATNVLPERRGDFPSYAEEVKSFTGGPVAKAFNMNFAALFDQVRAQRVRPSNWYVADEEARAVTEELIRDAGYDPVHVGDLTRARDLEDAAWLLLGTAPVGGVFYRLAVPGEL